ncbi:IS4 family transposase [Pendulispora albinea]|uniref:IS4 family transposase n=2 Tax=Pendulispora albinea TaxID=2741071 RepID=A0ABZ2MB11_9BACT
MDDSSGRDAREWAYEEFGHAELGDARRTARLVRMTASLAARPGGRVLEVFRSSAEQQAAYDFLSNEKVRSEDLLAAVRSATVRRCADESWVHVVVDGTSLRLTDWKREKGFGGVGSTQLGASGLKVIHAYAVSPQGVPLGVLNQQWWIRARRKKRIDCQSRPLEDKETRHWVDAIRDATLALTAGGSKAWFQVDREGDRYWTLKALRDSGEWFTVRSTYAHRFVYAGNLRRLQRLRDVARKGKVRGTVELELRERVHRTARTARVVIRTTSVVLYTKESYSDERMAVPLNVVDVKEVGTPPRGEKALHWRLLTNHGIVTREDVDGILHGYVQRWKIEELHRVWKSGACCVEQSQLRSAERVIKWAILAVVTAARIERLRMLARAKPDAPASLEFNDYELRALVLMKRKYAKKTESIPDDIPTIADAIRWIAQLGGHAGHASSGRPGSVTLRRGLEFITPVAIALELLENENKL